MNTLNELLKQKFASGSDVPVSSVRVTREEYETAVKAEREGQGPAVEVIDVNGIRMLSEFVTDLPLGPLYTRPQASTAVPEGFVKAIQTAIKVLDSDPGPMTREAVANGLRAMLAAKQPEDVATQILDMVVARSKIRKTGMIDGDILARDIRAMLASSEQPK